MKQGIAEESSAYAISSLMTATGESKESHRESQELMPLLPPVPCESGKGFRPALVTITIPALNEEQNIAKLLVELGRVLPMIGGVSFEILVVDDGSTDRTGDIAREFGARVVRHPEPLGNGAAVKRGIREARGDYILLMDGDGQHPPDAIPDMIANAGRYDMVVGSRGGTGGSLHRNLANKIYAMLATWVTGKKIPDLTSGFRMVRADILKGIVHLLPNTFSYPTTSTLALLRAGYSVHFQPIQVRQRGGKSKIHLFRDGSRFFLIILKVSTFFAPLRVFMPLSLFVAGIGVAWYLYTYFTTKRFTNMAVLILVQSSVLFCLGLISEQVAQLRFDRSEAMLDLRRPRESQPGTEAD